MDEVTQVLCAGLCGKLWPRRKLTCSLPGVEGRVCQTCRIHWRIENEPGFREKRQEQQREGYQRRFKENPEHFRVNQNQRYHRDPDTYTRRAKAWRLKHPLRQMLKAARARALQKGLAFSLQELDLILPETCPVLGIKLVLGNPVQGPDSPSLDRIDNSKGYVPGNVRVISWRANNLKGDATLQELELVVQDLRLHGTR